MENQDRSGQLTSHNVGLLRDRVNFLPTSFGKINSFRSNENQMKRLLKASLN